jgi:DNA-binding MarR family transcriptional regulator
VTDSMSSPFTPRGAGPDVGPPLIGALLRMPTDMVRARMLAALHARGFTDLTTAHFQVMRWPGPRGRRPVDLAEDAGMSRQAMNYVLGQLEELGYIERRVDPDDVRSRNVHLTPRGESTVQVIRSAVLEVDREWETLIGSARWRELKGLLLDLNSAIGSTSPGA